MSRSGSSGVGVVIEQGVPIPPVRRSKGTGHWKILALSMKIGESVLMEHREGRIMVASASVGRKHGARWAEEVRLTQRTVMVDGRKMLRIWRVE